MITSGKARIRTIKKHERRRHNDIALIRNFLNQLQTQGDDCVWFGIVSRILGIRAEVKWGSHQRARYVGIPNWFWPKVERICRENGIRELDPTHGETSYMYQAGQSTVREIVFWGNSALVAIATLLEIEIRTISHIKHSLPIATRMRNFQDVRLMVKERPVKKPSDIHATLYASTETVDRPDVFSVDKILAEIEDLDIKIKEKTIELHDMRDELDYKKELVRDYLSGKYGIS
ncbi:hypothetical protein UGMREWDR_CDS0142 [Aeromonas phage GomatiRiver_11]|nr:hypothetical protein OBDJBBDK_00134 [Aeromonas phage AhFM11]WKW84309.1 hypothetical protein UGMREWDR_CDS0142 [Aeromonas phage GomatiRiver_11]